MISRIRDVRRSLGLTLDEVARLCDPPTTAQTIGRLETGTRTLSLDWVNRIAAALGVAGSELVRREDDPDVPVLARLGAGGAHALTRPANAPTIKPGSNRVALEVESGTGDYRAGDVIWLEQVDPPGFSGALNRDVLVPRPAGRFLFGRLLGHDGEKLHILPMGSGQRQQVVAHPPWIAVAETLVRRL